MGYLDSLNITGSALTEPAVDMIILGTGYKPPDTVQGMETMDPLFPVTMPGDETMMQEGTASD